MKSFKKEKLFFFILLVSLIVLAFLVIKPFIITIISAFLVAYIFSPLHKKINQKIKRKAISSFLLCLIIILLVVIPFFFLAKTLIIEAHSFYLLSKEKITFLNDCQLTICHQIKSLSAQPLVQAEIKKISDQISLWLINSVSKIIFNLPRFFLLLFIFLFTLYFSFKEGTFISEEIKRRIPIRPLHKEKIFKRIKEVTNGVIYGHLLIAFIQGLMGMLAFLIFGLPLPILWGSLMALLTLVPFLGTGLVWVPASFLLLISGSYYKAIGFFFFCLVFVSLLDNFLRPMIIGKKIKTHPLIILTGVIGGIWTFGIVGIILGPLILEITLTTFDLYFKKEI